MGTSGADREEFIAAARQQDGFFADVPCQHASVGEIIGGDAPLKVRTGRI